MRFYPESLLDRIAVAANDDDGLWLMQLTRDANPTVRMNAARNPRLPAFVMKEVAEGSDEKVQLALTQNPNLTHEAGLILRDSPHGTVRYNLSRHQTLPLSSADYDPNKHSPFVKVELARSTDEHLLLLALAIDSDSTVVAAAEANPVLPDWLARNHPSLVGEPWLQVAAAVTA